ncbi:hypothetical protein APR41_13845 [Salegentibacter salinarum]|uniref:Putative beta-lactamase-inhibitor-like PepSY-like domain-containing protein n=1 Tax=Salegentibacter salinarum TaxID=447422 RepID=A0A2N0U048_9FLAO|nr:PepSY-like domain-containing protein [Salegentibacter salinarum]PKD20357.1 hypothetical protein APR41_13845 [Salegentibacter salinarum]SKB85719.1 Putative beta-lactamase-inhibitor-like, PepSY-like [Salegentibacter salinarum]
MKKVILSGIFTLCTLGIFAQTSTNNLPATAQEYIQQNFSSVDVKEVKENSKWQIWEDEKFEVILSNELELDFDENGNILEIESQNDVVIPIAALPSKIAAYVEENYADAQIIGWEKQKKEQEIELADGTELEFDGEGNFRKID